VSTIDVNFCSRVIIKLIKKKAKGIYNIGSRKSISKEKFALLFAEKIGKKLNYNSVSSSKSNIIRPKNLTMDISKIEKKLKILMPYPVEVINNLIKDLN
jgi:dTDP-4-dehydrorhamnose reductase